MLYRCTSIYRRFGESQRLRLQYPAVSYGLLNNYRHVNHQKRQEPHGQRHCVTTVKTCICLNTEVEKAFNLTYATILPYIYIYIYIWQIIICIYYEKEKSVWSYMYICVYIYIHIWSYWFPLVVIYTYYDKEKSVWSYLYIYYDKEKSVWSNWSEADPRSSQWKSDTTWHSSCSFQTRGIWCYLLHKL